MLRLHLFFSGVIDRIGLNPCGCILVIAEIYLADMWVWRVVINAFIR